MGNSYDNANIGHVQDAVNASFGNGKYSVSFADDSSSSSGGSGVHWGGGSGNGNSGNGSSSSGVNSKVAYKAQNMYLDSGATCYNVSIFGLMYAVDYNNTTVTGVRALSGTERMDNEQNRVNMARGQVEDLLLFVSAFNKSTIEKYGQQYKTTLEGLKVNIKGKKIKNYQQAMAIFEKVRSNPKFSLSSADRNALKLALIYTDAKVFGDNLSRLARSFGVLSMAVNVNKLIYAAIDGYVRNDWSPFMLQLEAIGLSAAASTAAGAIAAAVFAVIAAFVAVPVAVSTIGVALVAAMAGAFFDPERAEQINNWVITR
ncbi:colicin-like pore-forming protein [Serratia fonticola]